MFVLIVTTWIQFNFNFSPVVSMQEFTTQERCEAAAKVALKSTHGTSAECLAK